MKHHLEKLEEELAECKEIHQLAIKELHEMEHDDPAIAHIWNVLSAQTDVVCALAECMHHHLTVTHGESPRRMPSGNPASPTITG